MKSATSCHYVSKPSLTCTIRSDKYLCITQENQTYFQKFTVQSKIKLNLFLTNICLTSFSASTIRKITLHYLFPDLTDMDSYNKIVDTVSEKVKDAGLNVLFNNAGISSKFTRLGLMKKQQITDAFLVNTVAPIMLTKVCLQLFYIHEFYINK